MTKTRSVVIQSAAALCFIHTIIFLRIGHPFFDTDTFLHLVRLQTILSEGSLHATFLDRLNAPFGMHLHWTMLFDVFTLAVLAPAAACWGWPQALDSAGGLMGPVTHGMVLFSVIWAVHLFMKGWPLQLTAFGTVFGLLLLSYGVYGRLDHHLFMTAFLILTAGALVRMVLYKNKTLPGILTGIFAAAALWISPEMIPVVLWTIAAMAAAWSLNPCDYDKGIQTFIASFMSSCAAILFINPPPGGLWAMDFSRFALPVVIFSLFTGLAWAAAFAFGGKKESVRRRFLIIFGSLGAAAVLYTILFMKYFQTDETMKAAELLSHFIKEYKSPLKESLPHVIFVTGRTFMGVFAVLALAWADRKKPSAWVWAVFLVLYLGYAFLALKHLRFVIYMDVLALIPLAIGAWRLILHQEKKRGSGAPGLRMILFLLVVFGPVLLGAMLGLSEKEPPYLKRFEQRFAAQPLILERWRETLKEREPDCELKDIIPTLRNPGGLGAKSHLIAAELNFAPELLYRTAHRFISGPYGSYHALRDGIDFFYRRPVSKAHEIAAARGVEYVLVCSYTYGWHESPHPDSFFTRIALGKPVEWLEEIAWPENVKTDFRLWRVDRV